MTERSKYLVCGTIPAVAAGAAYTMLQNGSTRLYLYISLVVCTVAAVGFFIGAIVAFVTGDDR
ncbi:hypothetical protein [Streptosporangium sp. NPDC000509]|uniref:hypothetical protein n=1 Tax=Streptosporangium sp. NPDC000509 TaxID=3366186 RepID=UPI0036D14605